MFISETIQYNTMIWFNYSLVELHQWEKTPVIRGNASSYSFVCPIEFYFNLHLFSIYSALIFHLMRENRQTRNESQFSEMSHDFPYPANATRDWSWVWIPAGNAHFSLMGTLFTNLQFKILYTIFPLSILIFILYFYIFHTMREKSSLLRKYCSQKKIENIFILFILIIKTYEIPLLATNYPYTLLL
jgi:hypothetical protein